MFRRISLFGKAKKDLSYTLLEVLLPSRALLLDFVVVESSHIQDHFRAKNESIFSRNRSILNMPRFFAHSTIEKKAREIINFFS